MLWELHVEWRYEGMKWMEKQGAGRREGKKASEGYRSAQMEVGYSLR